MRFWLIGCGVVLVVVVGIVIFFGNILLRQFKEATGKVDDAAVLYQQLESDHSFEPAWGRTLTPEGVARFVDCRKEILARMKSLILVLEDEELSDFEKMTRSFDIIPSLAKSHADALGRVKMSPREYLWILNQVLVVIKYAENDTAPEPLKSLYDSLDGPREGQPNYGVLASPSYFPDSPTQMRSDLLPQIEPWQINMAQENIEAVLANRAGLEETALIFYCFDHYFKTTYRQLLHAKDRIDETASPPTPVPVPDGEAHETDAR